LLLIIHSKDVLTYLKTSSHFLRNPAVLLHTQIVNQTTKYGSRGCRGTVHVDAKKPIKLSAAARQFIVLAEF